MRNQLSTVGKVLPVSAAVGLLLASCGDEGTLGW